MCFDICTINIRVSIRVRGLHLVSWPEPACKVRWSDRFLASEQIALDQKGVLVNCIGEPRELTNTNWHQHVEASATCSDQAPHVKPHYTTNFHDGLAQWPQTPPWGMLFQSSTSLASQDVLLSSSLHAKSRQDSLHCVSDEYFWRVLFCFIMLYFALFGKCLLLSTGIADPEISPHLICTRQLSSQTPQSEQVGLQRGTCQILPRLLDLCVQKNTPLRAMQVRVISSY